MLAADRMQMLALPVISYLKLALCGSDTPQSTGPGSERTGAFIVTPRLMQDYVETGIRARRLGLSMAKEQLEFALADDRSQLLGHRPAVSPALTRLPFPYFKNQPQVVAPAQVLEALKGKEDFGLRVPGTGTHHKSN